jgi:hypothetical protein
MIGSVNIAPARRGDTDFTPFLLGFSPVAADSTAGTPGNRVFPDASAGRRARRVADVDGTLPTRHDSCT